VMTNDGVYQCCGVLVVDGLGCDWWAGLQRLEAVAVTVVK
jgi:hypothetical protein